MRNRITLALASIFAMATFASAADTVVTIDGNSLLIVSADKKSQIRCETFVFTPAGKAATTLSVVDGMVQLKNADITVSAAELHLADLSGKCEAIGNGSVTITKKAGNK